MMCSVFNLYCHTHARFYVNCCQYWCCLCFSDGLVVGDVDLNHWCFAVLFWVVVCSALALYTQGTPTSVWQMCELVFYSFLFCWLLWCWCAFCFSCFCCSSMSSAMNSSLNCGRSSKFVDPVHSLSRVACLFVVQSSSTE